MMDRYDPGADAAERYPHVTIRHRRLGGVIAVTDLRRNVILVERDASLAVRRAALAHELAHLDLAHDGRPSGIDECRREHRADVVAAERLICLDALADALRWALCPEEVAHVLDVTPHMVRVRVRGLTACEKAYIESRLAGDDREIA